jgi:DNA-binding transcriptional MerR regulator
MKNLIVGLAAAELEISTRTLGRWAQSGRIHSRITTGGWRLYDWDDIQRLKKELLKRRGVNLRGGGRG